MKTVYVGEIDCSVNYSNKTGDKYFVDHVAKLAENTKKLNVYSASFNTFKEANDYRNDLIADL